MDKLFETVKKCYLNFYHSHVRIVKSLNTIETYLNEVTSGANFNEDAQVAFKECKNLTNSHVDSTKSFMHHAMKLYKRLYIYKMRNVDELKEMAKYRKEPQEEFNYKR
jgi:hypothetical protein